MNLSEIREIKRWLIHTASTPPTETSEREALMLGRLLSRDVKKQREISSLHEIEFKVFSQFGDDGIIQWLAANIHLPQKTFIEFGVEDYRESNTRFLMMNDNWSGLVLDGSEENINKIKASKYYWLHELQALEIFINAENISTVISEAGFCGEIGILHIDLDGNDYWIWKAITNIYPVIVIMEYNAVFGYERAITVPYDEKFYRTNKHYSNLYFGASLGALVNLAQEKKYALVGCNSAGNNAYFVRRDRMIPTLPELTTVDAYVASKFRESRDENFDPTFISGAHRLALIERMDVLNVKTGLLEKL